MTDRSLYYDRDGRAIDLRQWSQLMHDDEYRRIAEDVVAERWWVSTVWLGLDHNHLAAVFGGAPLIFETMVFDPEGGDHDTEMERYATESEARAGHQHMVERIRAQN